MVEIITGKRRRQRGKASENDNITPMVFALLLVRGHHA